MNTLRVRNEAQAILFEEELKGQLSDGMWENTTPHDHWIVWCDAEVVVDPLNVGRNFWARKTSYRLDHPMLLEVVGDRMIGEVIRRTNKPYDLAHLKADLKDLKGIMKTWAE